jgi:hypothetical protein
MRGRRPAGGCAGPTPCRGLSCGRVRRGLGPEPVPPEDGACWGSHRVLGSWGSPRPTRIGGSPRPRSPSGRSAARRVPAPASETTVGRVPSPGAGGARRHAGAPAPGRGRFACEGGIGRFPERVRGGGDARRVAVPASRRSDADGHAGEELVEPGAGEAVGVKRPGESPVRARLQPDPEPEEQGEGGGHEDPGRGQARWMDLEPARRRRVPALDRSPGAEERVRLVERVRDEVEGRRPRPRPPAAPETPGRGRPFRLERAGPRRQIGRVPAAEGKSARARGSGTTTPAPRPRARHLPADAARP